MKHKVSLVGKQVLQECIWLGGNYIYRNWFHLSSYGLENLPKQGGYILAANHVSHLDGPAIIAAQQHHIERVYSLAANDYFFNASIKAWVCQNCLNMIPFRRRGSFRECLPICQQLLSEHKILLIFPEGTRSQTGEIQPLKLGLGMLMIYLDVPVIPTYVHGTFQALPKGKAFPSRYPIQVRFGKPIEPDRYDDWTLELTHHQLYREIVADVRQAITRLRDDANS